MRSTDQLGLLRSNLLGNTLEAKPTRWKDLMWAFQSGGKKQREMLLEKRWNTASSEWMDRAELLTTSSSNVTIPPRHDVALALIGLNAPKGSHSCITMIRLVTSGIKQITLSKVHDLL